jgi:hypothetical protein
MTLAAARALLIDRLEAVDPDLRVVRYGRAIDRPAAGPWAILETTGAAPPLSISSGRVFTIDVFVMPGREDPDTAGNLLDLLLDAVLDALEATDPTQGSTDWTGCQLTTYADLGLAARVSVDVAT